MKHIKSSAINFNFEMRKKKLKFLNPSIGIVKRDLKTMYSLINRILYNFNWKVNSNKHAHT
jgi:hypothetical protein